MFFVINGDLDLKNMKKYLFFQNKDLLYKNSNLDDEFVLVCKDFTCSPSITDVGGLKDILFGKLPKERVK